MYNMIGQVNCLLISIWLAWSAGCCKLPPATLLRNAHAWIIFWDACRYSTASTASSWSSLIICILAPESTFKYLPTRRVIWHIKLCWCSIGYIYKGWWRMFTLLINERIRKFPLIIKIFQMESRHSKIANKILNSREFRQPYHFFLTIDVWRVQHIA